MLGVPILAAGCGLSVCGNRWVWSECFWKMKGVLRVFIIAGGSG